MDGQMRLNQYGEIVESVWNELPSHYNDVQQDLFAVMPNHVHGIIMLTGNSGLVGAGLKPAPTAIEMPPNVRYPLPEVIRALKTFSARRINLLRGTPGIPVWQRNYYEHAIRNEDDLGEIRQHILNNPLRWELDEEYPNHL